MTKPGRLIADQLLICCLLFALASQATAQNDPQNKKAAQKKRVNPAFAAIEDDPKLPRVLLIGDSISIGYTLAARKELEGQANVHRIPANGGPTTNGLNNIDKWLGDGDWDVIHFNWGLHDLKYMDDKKQVSLEDYETNLRKLASRLNKTGATLIWCNTTPVPEGVSPPRKNSEVLEYNAVAAKVMKDYGIATDDLYTFANKQLDKIQRPMNVHFTPEGSNVLAKQVAESIRSAMKERAKAGAKDR